MVYRLVGTVRLLGVERDENVVGRGDGPAGLCRGGVS